MTNTNTTLFEIEDFKKDCSIHSQYCLSVQTLLENGSDPKHLEEVINEMRKQAELIESLSENLYVKKFEEMNLKVI